MSVCFLFAFSVGFFVLLVVVFCCFDYFFGGVIIINFFFFFGGVRVVVFLFVGVVCVFGIVYLRFFWFGFLCVCFFVGFY